MSKSKVRDDDFRTVSGRKDFISYKECEPGDVLVIGRFIGRGPKDRYRKRNYQFDREDDSPILCLHEVGQLAHIFNKDPGIPIGSWVKIIFEGRKTLDSGTFTGSECNQFKVMVSDKLSKVRSTSLSEEVESEDDDDFDLDDELETESELDADLDEDESDEEDVEVEEEERPKPKPVSKKKVTKKKVTKKKVEVEEDDDDFDDLDLSDWE